MTIFLLFYFHITIVTQLYYYFNNLSTSLTFCLYYATILWVKEADMKKKKIRFWEYVKPFWLPLLLSIVLLGIQAYGQLALPDYMSRVVDIGIGQGGVDSTAISAIRQEELDKFLLFLPADEKDYILSKYQLVTRENATKKEKEKYSILDEASYTTFVEENDISLQNVSSSVYIRTTDGSEDLSKIDSLLKTPFAIKQLIQTTDELKDLDIYTLSSEEAISLKEEVDAYFSEMGDVEGTINNLSIITAQNEYQQMGMDMANIQTNYIRDNALIMVMFTILIVASVGTEVFLASRIAASLGKTLRNDMFSKVISLSNNEFDQFSTASLITRTTNDINHIQNMVGTVLRILVFAPIIAIGALIKISNSAPNMRWIIFVAVVFISIGIITLFINIVPKFNILQELLDRVNLVLRESLSGLLVVRAFNRQDYQEEKFSKANMDLSMTMNKVARISVIMMPLIFLVFDMTQVAIVWFGGKQIDLGFMGVGDMMAFIQYAMQLLNSFVMITMLTMIVPRATIAIKRIFAVLNSESIIIDTDKPVTVEPEKIKGTVTFKDVCFQYQDADECVIEDINFVAEAGKTTAFIGSTGSGKSSIINLIPRFYDPTRGEILIDDINIKDISLHDLRSLLGFTPQQGLLFSGDIASNITYGDEPISETAMIKAAQIAQAEEFILELDDGYHSHIAQKGANVSGGQRQRLSIARSLAHDPPILIFDDSFSALDFKTDASLRQALHKEMGNKTILIVAQRIGTIRHADKIVVLDEGKIVGMGTHDELMKDCDIYVEIAQSQLSEEELKGDAS